VGRCDHSIMAATLKPSAKESDLVKPQKKLQHAMETAVARAKIEQRLAHVTSMPYELKVRILTGGDSTVDLSGHAGANLDHFGKRVLLASQ
jgi:hypothetical protein